MRGISEDEGCKIKEGDGEETQEVDMKFWKIKVIGDQISYVIPEKEPITQVVIKISNERWTGIYYVWEEGVFLIYISYLE